MYVEIIHHPGGVIPQNHKWIQQPLPLPQIMETEPRVNFGQMLFIPIFHPDENFQAIFAHPSLLISLREVCTSLSLVNVPKGPSINYVVQNIDFLMVCQSKSQKSYFWYWSLKTTSYFGKQSVPPCQNLQSINTNSIENKLTFLNFYWDTKNSSITTEKSVFTSSNSDWKCFLKSTIIVEIPVFDDVIFWWMVCLSLS